jgi:hypothetical protein
MNAVQRTERRSENKQADPDVVALRVERVRSQVERLCWSGIALGLAFTMTNVQQFAAGTAAVWSLPWSAAWMLDPTVSVPPVVVVFAAAQAITEIRDQLTEAISRAHHEAGMRRSTGEQYAHLPDAVNTAPSDVNVDTAEAFTDCAGDQFDAGNVRTSFAEYLADAVAAWRPGVHVTPAWVRQVTGCSRGMSSRLSRAVIASVTGTDTGMNGSIRGGGAR